MLSCGREDAKLAFTVEDEGVGIPDEYQATVFDRFESRTNGSGHRGAGLGLSIVKSLVELHGGEVALAPTPGHGTGQRAPAAQPRSGGRAGSGRRYRSSRAG